MTPSKKTPTPQKTTNPTDNKTKPKTENKHKLPVLSPAMERRHHTDRAKLEIDQMAVTSAATDHVNTEAKQAAEVSIERPTVQQIRDEIIRLATPKVKSSALGSALKLKFPALDFFSEYGGLKQFVETNCSGVVVWAGTGGGDEVYAANDSGSDETPSLKRARTLWSAFTNPSLESQVIANLKTGNLSITNSENTSLSSDEVAIDPVSIEEQKSFALQFISELGEAEIQIELQKAIETERYWAAWSRTLKQYEEKDLPKRWGTFRFAKLTEIFRLRLASLHFGEKEGEHAVDIMLESRSPAPPVERGESGETTQKPIAAVSATQKRQGRAEAHPTSAVRRVIYNALPHLSDDELRRIWLPLGAVVDAIKKETKR
jgi:hypothetical protein